MKACWLTDPLSRPTFTDIRERFEALISEGTPYVEFEIDSSNLYYNVPSFMSIENSTGDSLSDDPDEDEADWENRFRSLDHGFTSSPGERYLTRDEKGWLTTDPGERDGLHSVSSDTSATPLTDGVLQTKAEANDISEPRSPTLNGSINAPTQYQWGCEGRKSEFGPSTQEAVVDKNKTPFVIDN